MAENAWQQYADQVLNKFNYDTNEWEKTNVCSGAALYGHDGSLWAKGGTDDVNLTDYQHPQEQMDGSTKNVAVSEIACALGACDGNRQPSEAGIRMSNTKFMLTYKDEEAAVAQLARNGGGAVVGKCATCVVIGFWKKDQMQSDNMPQNMEDAYKLVKEMTAYLIEQGY